MYRPGAILQGIHAHIQRTLLMTNNIVCLNCTFTKVSSATKGTIKIRQCICLHMSDRRPNAVCAKHPATVSVAMLCHTHAISYPRTSSSSFLPLDSTTRYVCFRYAHNNASRVRHLREIARLRASILEQSAAAQHGDKHNTDGARSEDNEASRSAGHAADFDWVAAFEGKDRAGAGNVTPDALKIILREVGLDDDRLVA